MYETPDRSHRNRVIALVLIACGLVVAVVLALVLSGGSSAKAGQALGTPRPSGPSDTPGSSTSGSSGSGSSASTGSVSRGGTAPGGSSGHSAPRGGSATHGGPAGAPPPPISTSRAVGTTTAAGPTHVSVSVTGPAAYRGWCPVSMTYTATITVDHTPADISYHWNDGTASAGAPALHVTHSPVSISRTINPAASTTGSISLDVISPVSASSNTAHFSVACESVSVGSAPTVSPAAYTGDCSRGITFTFTDTVYVTNGPLTVQYRWTRSDGATGPTQTLSFGPGSSSQTVHTTWRLSGSDGSETFSEQLQVLGDHGTTSDPARFTIWCV